MPPRRLLPTAALGFALVSYAAPSAHAAPQPASAPPAPAASPLGSGGVDELAEFEKGKNAYRAQKYDEADARFIQMLDPEHGTLHDKVLIRQARMYWAATRLAEHHDDDAAGIFETILTEDRDFEPDPLAFPTEVVNAFIDTRSRLHARLEAIEREQFKRAAERKAREEAARQKEAARLALLEKLAGEAEVTEKHSRWNALLPFGIGQFQNGERTLGWFFLGVESALVVAGVVTLPLYYVDLADSKDVYSSATQPAANAYLDRANAVRDVNLAVYGALALTVIAGAVEAETNYVPRTLKTRPRTIPPVEDVPPPKAAPRVSLSFTAAPVSGRDGEGVRGGTVGVVGRF